MMDNARLTSLARSTHIIALSEMGGLQVLFRQLLKHADQVGSPITNIINRASAPPHADFCPYLSQISSPNLSPNLHHAANLLRPVAGTLLGSRLSRTLHKGLSIPETSGFVLHWNSLNASDSVPRTQRQILYDHGYSTLKTPNRIEIQRLRRVDGVVCVSESARTAFMNRFDLALPTVVVRNPIRALPDITLLSDQRETKTANKVRFGIAARLVPTKGVDLAIAAFARLQRHHEHIALHIAGTGPEEKRLTRHAHRLGAGESVFFEGHLRDVAEFFTRIDVLLAPSRREPFGLSPLEAIACGLPVIASNIDGHRENLAPLASARLFDMGVIGEVSAKHSTSRARSLRSFQVDALHDAMDVFLTSPPPPESVRAESEFVRKIFGQDAAFSRLDRTLQTLDAWTRPSKRSG